MIIGTLKGIVDKKTSDFVSKYAHDAIIRHPSFIINSSFQVGLFAW